MILRMFEPGQVYYSNWSKLYVVDKLWPRTEFGRTPNPPLYCAAYSGLDYVCRILINSGADVNVPSGVFGNALQAAAANGHLSVARTLLDALSNINAEGGRYGSALAAAAAGGHEAIVRELLKRGAAAQPRRWHFSGRRDDPLFVAALYGYASICDLLLKYGAEDYFQMKATPCSALHAATLGGHNDIVLKLLRHKKSLDNNSETHGLIQCANGGIQASLYSAAALGQEDILRKLIAYGISEDEVLWHAARAGDEDLVRQSLKNGGDHRGALQSAALGGHLSVVRELLACGADPKNALSAAVVGGNVEIVQLLIDAGAKVNTEHSEPLQAAISNNRVNFVALLVKHGADTHRPLQSAVMRGNLRAFRSLVDLGADITLRRPEDECGILQTAAFGGSVEIVQHLLESGLSPDPGHDGRETSPLFEAIRCREWQIVDILLDRGANVNAAPAVASEPRLSSCSTINDNIWPPPLSSETPLSMAIKNKNEIVANKLLERGASASPQTPVSTGTPLLHAIWNDMTNLVKTLLDGKADGNQRGTILNRGKPTFPLFLAAEKGDAKIINLLIGAGARINEQDDEGFSALHITAASGNANILSLLIDDHHADLYPRLLNGSQPIHSAASKGNAKCVQILLDAGVDVNTTNNDGRTPLHWAAEGKQWDTVELLLDRKADVNLKADENGLTALDLSHIAREGPNYYQRQMQEQTQRQMEGSPQSEAARSDRLLRRLWPRK